MTGGTKEKPNAYLTVLSEAYFKALDRDTPIYSKAPTTIGRNPLTNKIVIPDIGREEPEVSKEHVKIWFDQDKNSWLIMDIGSTNGTRLNDVPLKDLSEEALDDSDEITLGRLAYGGVRFLFRIADARGEIPVAENVGRVTT